MNLAQHITVKDAIAVAYAPEELSAIHHPGCVAALWHRQPLQSFQTWIDALEPGDLPQARMILRRESVHDVASEICNVCGTPDCAERAMLIDDIAAMAHIFAEIMGAPYLLMHLDVITSNARRKFRINTAEARLICTYRGTGTEYGIAQDGAEPKRTALVPTGTPILLRGTHWPDCQGANLLYRSPRVEDAGQTRLVLVLDPVVDPDAVPDQKLVH